MEWTNSISGELWAAIATAIVGLGSLLFALVQLSSNKQLADYGGRSALRMEYLRTFNDILEVGARLVTPRDGTQYHVDWHNFADLYVGRARLVPDDKFPEKLDLFADLVWDLEYKFAASDEIAEAQRLVALGELANTMRDFLNREFDLNSKAKNLKNRGPRKHKDGTDG